MRSVQTKEIPSSLDALSRAKGQRGTFTAEAQQPAATIMEESITETQPTPEVAPVAPAPATQPEAVNVNPRYSEQVYHDFRVHHDKKVTELGSEIKQLKDALSQATAVKIEFPKTAEELDSFKAENPDSYALIESIALKAAEKMGGQAKEELAEVKRLQAEAREQKAFAKLLEAHPDAKQIRESTEFAKWYNEQPEAIQTTLANSGDVDSVIKLLTLYKVETTGITPKEAKAAAAKERVDASLGVNIKGKTEIVQQKKIWTRSEINVISSNYDLWNKNRVEIDEARREGRVDETK